MKAIPWKLFGIILFLLCATNNSLAVEYQKGEEQEAIVHHDEATRLSQELLEEPKPTYQQQGTELGAEDRASKYLSSKGLGVGWDEEKNMYIAIGTAFFDSNDPSYDKSYITKRSLKSIEATLTAKAEIIEFIDTKMSALDKATTPGTNLYAEFNDKIDEQRQIMLSQRNKVAKLLADMDRKEADALRGATTADRANSLMDAAIKKLDKTYSVENVEKQKKIKFEKAKKQYLQAQNELIAVKKKLKAIEGSVTGTLESNVETLSKMPLFGAVTVAQFESWNEYDNSEKDGRYEVAMVVMWSTKMEKVVRAILENKDYPVPPGSMSLKEWVASQDWSTSTGGRRFRDNRGNVHFIGIAASALGKSSSQEKKARGMSEQFAKKEVAMGVYADVESYKKASEMMQTRQGGEKDSSVAVESFSSALQQEIKNRHISGLQRIYGKKYTHPISHQKIYVSIYATSAESARSALEVQNSNYLTKILDVKSQQRLKGINDAHREMVREAQNDRTTYDQTKSHVKNQMSKQISGMSSGQGSHASAGSQKGSGAGTYDGAGQDSMDW